jgi:translation initiation factor 4E
MPGLYDLMPNTDFMLFKADVRPEWEAPANKDGGKWVLTIENKEEAIGLQEVWEVLLCTMIGCTFAHYDHVNGAVFSVRDRYFRFSLWTRDATDKDILREIGKQFRVIAKLAPKVQVVYQLHVNALKRQLDNEFIMAL